MSRSPFLKQQITHRLANVCLVLVAQLLTASAQATLVSAVLPTSRSAQIESPITVFATVVNAGTTTATNCVPALGTAIDASLVHQTTNPATNATTGNANVATDISAGSSQSYVLQITPHAAFGPTDVVVDYICDNADTPSPLVGINTLLLSASAARTADIVALAATPGGAGILQAVTTTSAAFSIATFNVGSAATITATPVVLGQSLDALSICETNPVTGACLSPPAISVTLDVPEDGTSTFSVFMQHSGQVAFLPADNRISVSFTEAGVVRGSTSVAIRVEEADAQPPVAPTDTPPNVLFIISDDLGLDVSNQFPGTLAGPTTPVLDELANTGLVFDNAWAMPSCAPTRATLLTGEFGVTNGVPGTPGRLDLSTRILQRAVEENTDYKTAVFGKWHLGQGNTEPNHPNDLGVGHYAGNLSGNVNDYFSWDLTTNGTVTVETEYNTTKLTNLAIDWINQQTTPWFTWLAYIAPHAPFHLPPDDLQTSGLPDGQANIDANERAYYLAAIQAMDTEIGRLIDSLPPEQRDNTIIIYMGDNGTPRPLIDTRVFAASHSKSSLYEGGVGVPMTVNGAGVTRTGERESALVNTADLFATVSELTGSTAPAPVTSHSFAPLFSDANAPSRAFNYAEIEGNAATGWTTRNGRYKLIVFTLDGTEELYDLVADPDEANNLIGDSSLAGIRNELFEYGQTVRGEATGSDTTVDITKALLSNRSANCADYVASYRADALDVNNGTLFEGDLVISVVGDTCVFTTNMIPNHDFNDGANTFPNQVSVQSVAYSVTTQPVAAAFPAALTLDADNAVLLNGVKMDLLAAACFGVGDGRVGCNDINQPWRFDPMFAANGFRVDSHNAHTQPNGAYHYHGTPNALFEESTATESPVIGFAADGFPIFGSYFDDGAAIRRAESSYRLRSGDRSAQAGDPGGQYDGTYRDDWEYVAGLGDLDQCNGMTVNGVYGYFVTERFPYVLGCFVGVPDSSFNK